MEVLQNKVYDRNECMYGLLKLAEQCDLADYWSKKFKEDKTFSDINGAEEFDLKLENFRTGMYIILGSNEECRLVWNEFRQHIKDLEECKFKNHQDIIEQMLPVAYGVVTDYTLKSGRHYRPKVKVKINYEEYIVKQEIHFFMEHMYKRWLNNESEFFDSATTIIDLKDDYDLEQMGRNLPESYTKMDSIFKSDLQKELMNKLFVKCGDDGEYLCNVTCWDMLL